MELLNNSNINYPQNFADNFFDLCLNFDPEVNDATEYKNVATIALQFLLRSKYYISEIPNLIKIFEDPRCVQLKPWLLENFDYSIVDGNTAIVKSSLAERENWFRQFSERNSLN